MSIWEDNLAFYDKLIGLNTNFVRKGKTVPYTSANGYMFSQLNKEGQIGIRLSKERAKRFISEHDSGPFKSYGATMRDYVLIPETLYSNIDMLADLMQEAYENVMALTPK